MDGAKKSNYHIYVVCGVLLVLLGTRTIGYRFPMLESSGLVGRQPKCEICGKDATTTLNIGNSVHSLCEDHARIEGAESMNNSTSALAKPVQSGDETSNEPVRTVDGIAVFGSELTDADIEAIRKAVAELPDFPPPDPAENSLEDGRVEAGIDPHAKRVLSIRRKDESEVHVYTGELSGPSDGGGYFFRMRKEQDRWVVMKIGRWTS